MEKPRLNRTAVEGRMLLLGIGSHAQLSRLLGEERTYTGKMVRGDRPVQPSFLLKLAQVLDVDPRTLILSTSAHANAALTEAAS